MSRRKHAVNGRREPLVTLPRVFLPFGGLAASEAAHLLGILSVSGILLILTWICAALWLLYLGRFCIHIHLGYIGYFHGRLPSTTPPDAARRVGRLTLLDSVLLVFWALDLGLILRARSPMLAAPTWFVLYISALCLAGATVEAAEHANLRRGTDVLRICRVVRWLWRVMDRAAPATFGVIGLILRRWRQRSDPQSVSPLVSVIVTTVLACSISAGVLDLRANASDPSAAGIGGSQPPSRGVASTYTANPQSGGTVSQMQPMPETTASPLTYAAVCGTSVLPGDGAQGIVRQELRALWLGDRHLHIDGAGAYQAGCAQAAYEEPGRRGTWIEVGVCAGVARTVAIAAPGYAPVLVYQQVARTALAAVDGGTLIGAYKRINVGNGDAVFLDTATGTRGFFRQTKVAAVLATPDTGAPACDRFTTAGAPYTETPSALTSAWTNLVAKRGDWIWPVADASYVGPGSRYVLDDPALGAVVGAAVCISIGCTVSAEGRTTWSPSGPLASVGKLPQYRASPMPSTAPPM